ncbi:MAG: AhpC/TSA family protein [Lewinellaceae bacterium]|nr:AhpC/TSA family protein [Lewinellaceae bacterium]
MKKIKFLLFFLLPAIVAVPSCQTGPEMYTIKGTVKNASDLQVLLEQLYFDQNTAPTAVGRVTCDASGSFTIEQKEPFAAGLYRLTIGAKRLFFMLGGDEKEVSFDADLNTIDRMELTVTGSETFSCYAKVVKEMINAGQITPESAKGFVDKACNPLMRAFFTAQLFGRNAGDHLDDFKNASTALNTAMPESKYATEFSKMVNTLETQMLQQQQQATGPIQVGQPAPDISLPGPDGKIRSLSSMKGKVVLLDFWASWCRPCRMANPHVVEVYNKYKDRGFDVFSVSLDRPGQKDAWTAAIKQDGLVWDNHVSDLKFWSSAPVAVYGVNSIPRTFLIDREGKIVALNPRADLEQQLLKVL